jgi:serine protease
VTPSSPETRPPSVITARTLATTLLLGSLAGCGGGGSSSSAPGAATAPAAASSSDPESSEPVNAAPAAHIHASPGDATGRWVFDGSGSSDPEGPIAGWHWDFGDGATAEGETHTHRFDASGTYEVRLTVTDADGAEAGTVRTVEVAEDGVRVAGTLRIQASSVVDADTNDPGTLTGDNDTLAGSQAIPNPATVGGYVAAAGRGTTDGVHHAGGDRTDVFRFEALGGERAVLNVGDGREDLDLRLYDGTGALVDESLGIDPTEMLDVPDAAGTYYLEVSVFGDAASTYLLTIGRGPDVSGFAAGAGPGLVASADFVPGEVLVGPATGTDRGRPVPDLAPADGRRARGDRGGRARIDGEWRVRSVQARDAVPLADRQLATRRTLEAVKALRASGRYDWVEPNWIRKPLMAPSDAYFPNQWNLHTTRFPQAWDLETGRDDVVVAVLDTGILPHHPEFGGAAGSRLLPGHDFVSDAARAGDGDGRDADPTDPGESDLGGTSRFHGTHVAGIVAARADNGGDGGGGIAGAAHGVRVLPVRVLGQGGGTSADLVEGLRWAAGLPNATGTLPERPADVINLSLGGPSFSQAEQAVIDEVRATGVIVVAAAGNDASDSATYPAAYAGVVSVAATTIADEPAYYSNSGPTVDVAAPGGDTSTDVNGDGIADGVISTIGEDVDDDPSTPPEARLGVLAGTSMAAPHVAAAAALMKSVWPGLTPETFDQLLAAGRLTVDLGEAGRDDAHGHGLIDARSAVLAALDASGGMGEVPGLLVSSPSALNFGPFTDRLEYRLTNAGTEALTAEDPAVDVPWLEVTAVDVDADGLGTYAVTVDRSVLPEDGLYRTSIRVDSSANPAWIDVQVQRSAVDLAADLGLVKVLLVPEGADEPTHRSTAIARAGEYDFRFDGVAPGRYHLIAGTDADFDGVVCETGEGCGAWRTLSDPAVLEVGASARDDVEFVTAFRTAISPGGPVPAAD